MKTAIKNYFDKLKVYPNYYQNEDFSKISSEIKNKFVGGIVPIERQDRTNIEIFKEEFGYELPMEIADYINIFWHPHICGYLTTKEAIILYYFLF